MPFAALPAIAVLAITLTGCASNAGVGEACDRHSDCGNTLQCVRRVCTPRCQRATECGDGYSCDERGLCLVARGQDGESCTSEVDCAPGLSCRIEVVPPAGLIKRCAPQTTGAPVGAACVADEDCHNGACALGRCVDLCRSVRDCPIGTSCMQIPHVEASGVPFGGCLVSNGVVSWTIPSPPPDRSEILLPVPKGAIHASLVLSTPAPRTVAATRVTSPSGRVMYRLCPPDLMGESCSDADQRSQFYANDIRHRRELGISVLAIPSTSRDALEADAAAYRVAVRSFHVDGSAGPPPSITAVVRLGALLPPDTLDLHFHFLDLSDHPCGAAFDTPKLDQRSAPSEARFQHEFIDTLKSILIEDGALAVGTITYEDIVRPELDGLEIANAGALLELGKHPQGINVFFVRNLSPAGIGAYGPNPGPAGLAGTPRSGIVVGIDTLCYRSWEQLARLTAHEIARYMGLYPNVELGGGLDGIDDSDTSTDNLMFHSELGGTKLSAGQRDILRRSPVLR